ASPWARASAASCFRCRTSACASTAASTRRSSIPPPALWPAPAAASRRSTSTSPGRSSSRRRASSGCGDRPQPNAERRRRTANAERRISGQRLDLDVPERDWELLILQPDVPVGELRVVDVERRLAVQDDDQVIAVGGDLVDVPLIGLEVERARRL